MLISNSWYFGGGKKTGEKSGKLFTLGKDTFC